VFPLVLLLLNTAEAPCKQVACGSSEQLSYCRVGFSVFLLETAGTLGKLLATQILLAPLMHAVALLMMGHYTSFLTNPCLG